MTLVKCVSISAKELAPPDQARPSTGKVKTKNVEAEKEPDASRLVVLLADVQKDLNMPHNVTMQFSVHTDAGKIMVTVKHASTNKTFNPKDLRGDLRVTTRSIYR